MTSTTPRSLTVAEIELPLDPAWFPFTTTAELQPLDGLVAQPRAVRALELGLGVRGSGYNIFAIGLSGTNLPRLLRTFVEARIAGQPTPPDWVFVNNFDEPDRPLALSLPAGQGAQLRRDMRELPLKLVQILPRALQYQGFNQEKERLQRDCNQRCEELFQQLREMAVQRELHVDIGPEGNLVFAPLRELVPLTTEETAQLSLEELEAFLQRQVDLLRETQPILEQQQAAILELGKAIQSIERTLAEAILTSMIDPLWQRYAVEPVRVWLDRVKQHMLDNLAPFFGMPMPPPSPPPPQEGEAPPQQQPMPMAPPPLPANWDYEVNVVVDNGNRQGPPVLVEDVPTYKNLFGFVERSIDFTGRILTHFTQIKSGTLLRGNGGVVLFYLDDAIDEMLMWKELKRTLKNRRIQIDSYDTNVPLGASGLKPQAIPLDVKLVVVGSPNLFYYLSVMDPDFNELFKVKAEFAFEMPLDATLCGYYARLVRLLSEREGLKPFDNGAVRELVRYGARLVADRRQVSADFSQVAGVAREAGYWCNQAGAQVVNVAHVRQALEERVYRSNWFAVQTLELMKDGTLLIRPVGKGVGQINSLTVLSLGDYSFGRPARLTASAWVGQTGVINIERESRLSGSTHDKGMLIMEGYLRGKYAQQMPIGLGASMAFEQSYSGIDGDSASAAELFCLVSALSRLPLRQDVGVTGSVTQHGEIQAIGGINEKIEGFFDVCRLTGLTGTQGVCFPKANVTNLVLRPDVIEEMGRGRFHLWPIETLDEGLELLTGNRAGDIHDPESVHGRVAARFQQISQAMRETPPSPLERAVSTTGAIVPPPPPAPPELPPHG